MLIVQQMGKEISGEGLDPNITGKRANGPVAGGSRITRIGVLELSKESDGNVVGIGAVDVITEKLRDRIDYDITYSNCLTTGGLPNVRIPMALASDEEVIRAAVHSSKVDDPAKNRMVLINDTVHLSELYVSEALLEEMKADKRLTVVSEFEEIPLSGDGELGIQWR